MVDVQVHVLLTSVPTPATSLHVTQIIKCVPASREARSEMKLDPSLLLGAHRRKPNVVFIHGAFCFICLYLFWWMWSRRSSVIETRVQTRFILKSEQLTVRTRTEPLVHEKLQRVFLSSDAINVNVSTMNVNTVRSSFQSESNRKCWTWNQLIGWIKCSFNSRSMC